MERNRRPSLAWKILWILLLVPVILLVRPVLFLGYVYLNDPATVINEEKSGVVNDASHLNEIKVKQVLRVKRDRNEAILQICGMNDPFCGVS